MINTGKVLDRVSNSGTGWRKSPFSLHISVSFLSFFSMLSRNVLIKWLHKIYLEGNHTIEYSTAGYVSNVGFFAFGTFSAKKKQPYNNNNSHMENFIEIR